MNEQPGDVCITPLCPGINSLTFIKTMPADGLKYSTSRDNRAFYHAPLLMVNLAFADAPKSAPGAAAVYWR